MTCEANVLQRGQRINVRLPSELTCRRSSRQERCKSSENLLTNCKVKYFDLYTTVCQTWSRKRGRCGMCRDDDKCTRHGEPPGRWFVIYARRSLQCVSLAAKLSGTKWLHLKGCKRPLILYEERRDKTGWADVQRVKISSWQSLAINHKTKSQEAYFLPRVGGRHQQTPAPSSNNAHAKSFLLVWLSCSPPAGQDLWYEGMGVG